MDTKHRTGPANRTHPLGIDVSRYEGDLDLADLVMKGLIMSPTKEEWERSVEPKAGKKSNWEQILEQDPELRRAQTERSRVLVLKEGELEIHLDYHAYQGNFRYDLRMWAMIEGQMRPTKKGLVIFPSQIQEFIRLLADLVLGGDQT